MTFRLSGKTKINRMGFGTMRLPAWPTGKQIDRETAHAVLRRAVELGVNHIDTAGFYVRDGLAANELIREALHPYPENLVLATKIGPRFNADGSPGDTAVSVAELREQLEKDLGELGADRIGMVNIRLGGIEGPFDGDARTVVESMAALQQEGLFDHISLSNVTSAVLDSALEIAPIAAVQNSFNIANQSDSALVDRCAAENIGYVPFFPLGGHVNPGLLEGEALVRVAGEHGETPSRVALAWLLHRAPNILLIPGTSSVEHLEQNVTATEVELSSEDMAALSEGTTERAS